MVEVMEVYKEVRAEITRKILP